MVVIVMASTMSVTVNTHYCGNILVDKAIMKPAKKCAMHEQQTHHEQDNLKDDCCDDEVELIEGQDQLKVQSSNYELPLPVFVEAFVFTFFLKYSFKVEVKTAIYEAPPPTQQIDFQILHQVFLIWYIKT